MSISRAKGLNKFKCPHYTALMAAFHHSLAPFNFIIMQLCIINFSVKRRNK